MPRLRLRHAALTLPGRPPPFSLAGLFPAAFDAPPVTVLNNVCLDVGDGERLALRGPAGCGKSSLLRLLAGRMEPTAGSCDLWGDPVALLDLTAGLDPEASGRANLERLADGEADEAADLTQLGRLLDVPVRFCSPGMRWRIGFAAAAVRAGDVLLVDACLVGADMGYRPVALARLGRLLGRARLAVVAEPALYEACTRSVEMSEGRVVEPARREAA